MRIARNARRLGLVPLVLAPLVLALAACTSSGASPSPSVSAELLPPAYAATLAALKSVSPEADAIVWTSDGTSMPAGSFWATLVEKGGTSLDPTTPEYAVSYGPLLVGPADVAPDAVDQVIFLGDASTPTASYALVAYARVFGTPEAAQAWQDQNEATHALVAGAVPASIVTTAGGNPVTVYPGGSSIGPNAVMVTDNTVVSLTLFSLETGLTTDDLLSMLDKYAAAL